MKMIHAIQTFTFLSVTLCQKITHELPRVNPYKSPQSLHTGYTQHLHDVGLAPHPPPHPILPRKPYVSPLRPGYQWPVVSESEISSLHFPHPPAVRPHHPHHLTHQIPTHRHPQAHLPSLVPPPTQEYVSTIKYSAEKSLSKEAPFSLEESANLANVERPAREESEESVLLGTTESPAATTTTKPPTTSTTTSTTTTTAPLTTSSTQVSTTGATEYKIGYPVKDGDEFTHQISNDGEVNTKGEYRVALPDGRVQIVRYTAGGGGYQAKVTYKESEAVGSDDGDQLTEPPVPVVLVRSPQYNTSDADNGDSLFTNGVQPNIHNPKRNSLHEHVQSQHNRLNVAHHYLSHNKSPFFLGNNFQAIETAHYFVPKLQPKAYVQLPHNPPYYSPPQYSTNFLTSHPDIKSFPYSYSFPGQKPIRFPATPIQQLPRKSKFLPASKEESTKIKEPGPAKIHEPKSESLAINPDPTLRKKVKLTKIRKPKLANLRKKEPKSSPSLVTTLPPLLPAFHPDYRPPAPAMVTLEDVTEAEIGIGASGNLGNVPRFKHSALYSESLKPYKDTYNNLLPAFDPDFKKGRHSAIEGELLPAFHKDFKSSKTFLNFVTPLPDDKSDFEDGDLNVTSPEDSSQVFLPHHNSSFHPLMSMTQILYSMNKTTEIEDKNGSSEMEEMEITENISDETLVENTVGAKSSTVPDTEEGSGEWEGSGNFEIITELSSMSDVNVEYFP